MAKNHARRREGRSHQALGRAPDRVVGERMRSTEWCCDGCGEVFKTREPIPCPAPCPTCGGIAFTAPH